MRVDDLYHRVGRRKQRICTGFSEVHEQALGVPPYCASLNSHIALSGSCYLPSICWSDWMSKCQVMQWSKTEQGALKRGSITQMGTMAQELGKRKRRSSRLHGSCATDGAAISLESVTQRALSSCVVSHRQKPNPPGIQPSA